MRVAWIVVGLRLLLGSTAAEAQVAVMCPTPAPSSSTVVWGGKVVPALAWCLSDATLEDVKASTHTLYVNDGLGNTPLAADVAPSCLPLTEGGVACAAPIPAAVFATMRAGLTYTVQLTRRNESGTGPKSPPYTAYLVAAPGAPQMPAAPVVTTGTGCLNINLAVTPPVALATTATPGTPYGVRTSYSSTNHALAVQLLRRAGWHVEQQRVQWAAPVPATGMTNGYWLITAVCVGPPV